MSYLVLARKYRPRQFPELVGQQHVAQTLLNAFRLNKLGQAYLFTGTRGVGKTSAARIFAKALRCEHPDHQPGKAKYGLSCDACPSCQEINSGNSIDVLEIDGASNNGVDNVREICEAVKFLPSRGRTKVYIIDEVHMLTGAAFNALLKTLEEPPPHITFILATTEVHKIPATILSRCQRFDFKRVPQPMIVEYLLQILSKEGVKASNEAVRLIARKGDGSMRDSLSTLDQVLALSGKELSTEKTAEALGVVSSAFLYKLLGSSFSRDNGSLAKLVKDAFESGVDMKQLAQELCESFRDALFAKLGSEDALEELSKEEKAELAALVKPLSAESLQGGYRVMVQALDEIARSPIPKVSLEMALLRVAALGELLSFPEIVAKLQSGKQLSPAPTPQTTEKKSPEPAPIAAANSPLLHAATKPEPKATADQQKPNPAASWPGFVAFVLGQRAALGSLLEHALPASPDEQWRDAGARQLTIGFRKSHGFYMQQLQMKSNYEALNQCAQQYLGRDCKILIEALPDQFGSSSLKEEENAQKAQGFEQKKREFLAHEVVRNTKEIFGAELASFDINKGNGGRS